MKNATGTLTIHPRGFGFLEFDSPDDTLSAFVAPPDLNPFLAGDVVSASVTQSDDGRWSASNLKLIRRERHTVFGQVARHRGQAFLRIDREIANTDWKLQSGDCHDMPPEGAWIVARIAGDAVCCTRVLTEHDDLGMERVITRHELRAGFPDDVLGEAHSLADSVVAADRGRRDLREVPTLTIDSESTRDIDDAISVLPADKDGALRLIVSIADVSSVVRPGTALDREARIRATSVYLPDRVLPMLPPALSENRLSLLPGLDRECLSAELRITPEGDVVAVDVYRSLIRSYARLTYEVASAFLDGAGCADLEPAVCDTLKWCRTVSARLSMARAKRGGMEMAREEARFGIDASTGRATLLDPVRPTSAHMLVERCMVAANEAVAQWLLSRGVPAPFRVHDAPEPESVLHIDRIARNFGFAPGFGRLLSPLALGAFDRQVRASPAAPAIIAVLTRALGPARYSVHCSPHFGLAAATYLHFTSPIRRYADLLVHRAVGEYLDGSRPDDATPAGLEETCRDITSIAASAARAESDARRVIGARVMTSQAGSIFAGNVTGVRPFGLRVQLRDSLVVGHIAADSLPHGPFAFSDSTQELAGERTTFAVGSPVTVRVASADEWTGRVELELVDA